MTSQITSQYSVETLASPAARNADASGRENRADIARVAVALGLLALLASFDEPKETGLVAASAPAGIDATAPK